MWYWLTFWLCCKFFVCWSQQRKISPSDQQSLEGFTKNVLLPPDSVELQRNIEITEAIKKPSQETQISNFTSISLNQTTQKENYGQPASTVIEVGGLNPTATNLHHSTIDAKTLALTSEPKQDDDQKNIIPNGTAPVVPYHTPSE